MRCGGAVCRRWPLQSVRVHALRWPWRCAELAQSVRQKHIGARSALALRWPWHALRACVTAQALTSPARACRACADAVLACVRVHAPPTCYVGPGGAQIGARWHIGATLRQGKKKALQALACRADCAEVLTLVSKPIP